MNRVARHHRIPLRRARGLIAAVVFASGSMAVAQDTPSAGPARRPIPARVPSGAGGTTVVVVTGLLAIVGAGAALGAKHRRNGAAGGLQVIGRAHLTGRHAVYLLRTGERTLLIGVGPQGAPSLLGELDEPAQSASSSTPPTPTLAKRTVERSHEGMTQCA